MLRWVLTPHKHKGLVLAFLLILNKITHASIHAPVRMPYKFYYVNLKEQV